MADEKVTIIDAQADIEGKLKGKDAVVHGRVRGEIALTGRLVLGESARVEAAVSADAVEVAGRAQGRRARAQRDPRREGPGPGHGGRAGPGRAEGAWLSGSVAAGEGASKAAPADRPRRRPPGPPPRRRQGDKAGA